MVEVKVGDKIKVLNDCTMGTFRKNVIFTVEKILGDGLWTECERFVSFYDDTFELVGNVPIKETSEKAIGLTVSGMVNSMKQNNVEEMSFKVDNFEVTIKRT